MVIAFTYVNDLGEEVETELPAKHDVCSRCQGHGTHLRTAIGEHAYTREEFEESFDDEEAAEYFKRGGRYDVTCEECGGKNVVLVIDRKACRTPEQKAALKEYRRGQEDDAMYRRECEAERRLGC